jgi:hypothetical protein
MRRRLLLAASALFAPAWAMAAGSAAEQARIERLIRFVETHPEAKFVRNGTAYTGRDAAKFLRGKYQKMGEHVSTAQQFIEQIAAKSSTSGQQYLIRFADGRTVPSAQFLGAELARMDAAAP